MPGPGHEDALPFRELLGSAVDDPVFRGPEPGGLSTDGAKPDPPPCASILRVTKDRHPGTVVVPTRASTDRTGGGRCFESPQTGQRPPEQGQAYGGPQEEAPAVYESWLQYHTGQKAALGGQEVDGAEKEEGVGTFAANTPLLSARFKDSCPLRAPADLAAWTKDFRVERHRRLLALAWEVSYMVPGEGSGRYPQERLLEVIGRFDG